MNIFWTVLAGTSVYVLGQFITKLLVEPWLEYRALLGRITHALIFYQTAHSDPRFVTPVPVDEARRELRSLAGELWQRTTAIPFIWHFGRVYRLPNKEETRLAVSGLIGLSNSLHGHDSRAEHIRIVRENLRLFDPDRPVKGRAQAIELSDIDG